MRQVLFYLSVATANVFEVQVFRECQRALFLSLWSRMASH